MTALETLRQWTTLVADTGDIDEIIRVKPTEATTNPSLILKAANSPRGESFIRAALTVKESPAERTDRILVGFGTSILEHIPGRVSTEVDARLSFDVEGTVAKARRIIGLCEAAGVSRDRVLIKIAATWEGAQAVRILESEEIHCNMTLIFDVVQAIAAAQSGGTLISPFVGRIRDWHKAAAGDAWVDADNEGPADPGVRSVTEIFRTLKAAGSRTQIMGASFRNLEEIRAIAGCDLLTIAPKFIDALENSEEPLERRLDANAIAVTGPVSIGEVEFRTRLNASAMATEKLSQGIRAFVADTEKLENMLL